jgi:mediator of RNA polymerase II transcription subunit 12
MQLQFILRQMGRALSQESTHATANAGLDKLTSMIFHHSMTSEEAYFVAELARGVDSAVAGKVKAFFFLLCDTH